MFPELPLQEYDEVKFLFINGRVVFGVVTRNIIKSTTDTMYFVVSDPGDASSWKLHQVGPGNDMLGPPPRFSPNALSCAAVIAQKVCAGTDIMSSRFDIFVGQRHIGANEGGAGHGEVQENPVTENLVY